MNIQCLLRDLESQIAEEYAGATDEHGPMTARRLLSAQMWAHYDGQSKRRSFAKGQQIAELANPARVLAECAAKRAILAMAPDDEGYVKIDDWESCSDSCVPNIALSAIHALAAVYRDHPDWQQEWALEGDDK